MTDLHEGILEIFVESEQYRIYDAFATVSQYFTHMNEKDRARKKEQFRKLMADPEKRAKRNERQRKWIAAYRAKQKELGNDHRA